jgi:hypothetical protein
MGNLCKCGRSPNGQCNGWHRLSKSQFLKNLREYEIKTLKEESDRRLEQKKNGPAS